MVTLRLAQSADNAALLDLFAHVPMTGSLALVTRREPDFFALYDIQRGLRECWVYADGDRLSGMGTVLVREGWLDGQPCRVGYLGDLRGHFAGRRQRGLARFYGEIFEGVRRRYGCDVFLTAMLASNAVAINSLVRQRPERLCQPYYHLLRRFAVVSVHFTIRRHASTRRGVWVRHATETDIPAMGVLLDADHRRRPFGYRFDTGELAHRFARWPGLTLEHTYLAHDRHGHLMGCASAWDPSVLKSYQVEAYRGSMVWAKHGLNLLAALCGTPRLPEPGESFRAFYLCNVSIRDDNPVILRALLEHIYADFHPRGYHFFMVCMYEHDPLAPALRGFCRRALAFHLYAVTSSSAPRTVYPRGRPGFEMALA